MATVKEYIMPVDDTALDYDEMFIGVVRKQKELIRCKDCIHHHGYNCDRLYGMQGVFATMDEDYCARAERKEA